MTSGTNPFAGQVEGLDEEDLLLLERAVAERRCRDSLGFGTLEELAAAHRPDPPRPSCGARGAARDGSTAAGHARLRCRSCGRRYGSPAGTVFENCRKDLATWALFVELMTWNVPAGCAAEVCGISHKTAFEWRHRVFAAVSGHRDRVVLSGTVWIDETYAGDVDLAHGCGEARKRGPSGRKACMAVAIDGRKNPVAKVCGHGKPGSRRMRDALLPHLGRGSTVTRGMEKAHGALIRAAGRGSEAYRADCSDPVYLECMAMADNLCSWLKRYLWRFIGMDPKNLQSYLDWYVYLFRVNQAKDRWPKLERVLRHLVMADARYRT